MIEALERIASRHDELTNQMASPDVLADPQRLQQLAQERADLDDVVQRFQEFERIQKQIDDARLLAQVDDDPAMASMAKDEIAELQPRADRLMAELRELLVPRDPNDK